MAGVCQAAGVVRRRAGDPGEAVKDALAIWQALNQRQHTYLQALYDGDQATEAARRQRAARGFYDRTPASVWRWQLYGPTEPPTQLYSTLDRAGLVDQGTGATWRALASRQLVRCTTITDPLGIELLQVQITTQGRTVVRAALGQQAPKRPPAGQLRERQWAALARLYAAGDTGELSEEMMYGRGGFDWMYTLLRLREYKPQPLMEEFRDPEIDMLARMRLTPFGHTYYEREWARYRALYRKVEAQEPETT